ncbi:MAG TPA: hypothetical protein PKA58_04035 [Polyangium sp.]|nr:hypothetical protein [Polyangium sp.]
MRRQSWTLLLGFTKLLACLAAITSLWGCTPAVTWQALQNGGYDRNVTYSCIRPPPFGERGEFYAVNETTHEMVSDENPEAFWKAARTADRIIRYDPNAPSSPGPRLPWPYHNMECEEASSGDVPTLPKGMKQIIISHELREAMVRALTTRSLRTRAPVEQADKPSPELVGQVLLMPPRPEDYTNAINEIGQMLRDAARGHLPTVKREGAGPHDENISIIDTKEGQIIGGLGAGFAIGSVPGGTFIAQGTMASGDKPTREFILAEGLGEMLSGGVQFSVGTGMTAGGGGLSLTGGGALVGVPTCAAGIALAANGAVTFINGGSKVIVALCHWEELPAAANAAEANASGSTAAAAGSTAPSGVANGGSAAKPAAAAATAGAPTTPPAAKPATKPASTPAATSPAPAATSATPPQAAPTLHLGRHYGSGINKTANSTTWVRCTGQVHHAISKKIHVELEKYPNLKGVYKYRDNRFVTQAIDKAAHNGYDKWHRAYEEQVKDWLRVHHTATPAEFEAYLFDLYKTDNALNWRFPNGL